jgi:hypothetical protein
LKTILKFLEEAQVFNPNIRPAPLKDSDTITVYHGFYGSDDALQAMRFGLSGQEIARRLYSYESGNNPKGLFVTAMFRIAEKFARSGIIIEFAAKVSDLESPVWKGGRFFVPGEYTKNFRDDEERELERQAQRDYAAKSTEDFISQSDRPELSAMLYDSGERQALFIGNLDPNQIKRVWVHENRLFNRRTDGHYVKMSSGEFVRKYSDRILKKNKQDHYSKEKWFKPNEDFSWDRIAEIYGERIEDIEKTKIDILKWPRFVYPMLFPKQRRQLDAMIAVGNDFVSE